MGGKKKWRKKLAVVALTAVVGFGQPELNSSAAQSNEADKKLIAGKLPLGYPDLPERRTVESPAPGLEITTVVRGYRDSKAFYTVNAATVRDRAKAAQITTLLKRAGFDARMELLNERALDDPASGPYGYRVRVGRYKNKSSAEAMLKKINKAGIRHKDSLIGGTVQYSGEDGGLTTGPWEIRIVTVDPKKYGGEFRTAIATPDGTGGETVSSMVRRTGALMGINGSYFVSKASNGTIGDVEGFSMMNGRIVSEAVNNTASFILPSPNGLGAKIDKLTMKISVQSSDGSTEIVDGMNRKPGLILRCGGVHDTPTVLPRQSYLCKDANELIYFTEEFGKNADAGSGVQVTLDKTGKVVSIAEKRGGRIPKDGAVLQGTGTGAAWLRRHAKVGAKLKISHEIKTSDGKRLTTNNKMSAISAGPILLKDGLPLIDATAEGFNWPSSTLFYDFGVRRHPRTIAGITSGGKFIFVVAEGRNPGTAAGLSLMEEMKLMRSLGAVDAINLDGGGSSTFVGPDGLRGNPSDGKERMVGDALLVMPPK